MDEIPYPYAQTRVEYRFEFKSVSAEKVVDKVVLLSASNDNQIYNLALFDILPDGNLSDLSETNNKDLKTVLATVIIIIVNFLGNHPDTFVFFQGSDARRQRLYRAVINKEYNQIETNFVVRGGIGQTVEIFRPNRPYEYFIINKKQT